MTELFTQFPAIFVGVAFAFALVIGSFLNVIIYRLPIMMERDWREQCAEIAKSPATELPTGRFNLVLPGSHCPSCGKAIRTWQNIPVLSYLMLGGRCANCRKAISTRYPLVELATGVVVAITAWRFGFGAEGLVAMALTAALVPVTMIDVDRQLIPDAIVLPLVWAGLLLCLWHPLPGADTLFIAPRDAIIGAIAGYLSLWSVYWLFKLVTGKEGMGHGDFKLLAALGAWLGWQALPTIILLSAVVGAVVGISLIAIKGRDRHQPIPFGPYLAAAGWITLLHGDLIRQAYFDLVL